MVMRRVLNWVAVMGLLAGGLVLGTQVSAPSRAAAAVNGAWSALGDGLNGRVMVTYQENPAAAISSSNPLYVGGFFTNAGGDADADYLAKWDGSAWSKVANTALHTSGSTSGVHVAAIAKSGSDLYVGGVFTDGTSPNMAKISSGSVTRLGKGMSGGLWSAAVEEIAVLGSNIYVGGSFGAVGNSAAGDVPNTSGIAKWNGTAWSALQDGLDGSEPYVNALLVDGSDLYIGGQFTGGFQTGVADVSSKRVLRWNGTNWFALEEGFNSGLVGSFAKFGTDIIAGGTFPKTQKTTQIDVNGVAKWSGSAWSAVGTGVAGTNAVVETFAVAGSTLWAGGEFSSAGGVTATNIAKWDGTSWDALVCGPENGVRGGAVRGIAPQSDGSLIIAGGFTNAGGNRFIAKFTPGADNCAPLVNGPTEPRNVLAEWIFATETVRISWNAPESSGSLPITAYRAVSFDDNVYCWTQGFSCEISVNDVPDTARMASGEFAIRRWDKFIYLDQLVQHSGVSQGFYAQAGNSAGWGLKGWAPKPPEPTPPSAPTIVKATPGRNQITVTWSSSTVAVTRGLTYPITNYLVRANPGGRVCITRLTDASLTTCTYENLKPGVDYTFNVQGLNGAGWGAMSKASNEASAFDLKLVDVKARKKLLIFREVTVVGTAPGFKAGERVRLFWRQVGTEKWITEKGEVATVTGKPAQRYTFKVDLLRKTAGKDFEFRLTSGGESSNILPIRIP
jgi:hypothetical protein